MDWTEGQGEGRNQFPGESTDSAFVDQGRTQEALRIKLRIGLRDRDNYADIHVRTLCVM